MTQYHAIKQTNSGDKFYVGLVDPSDVKEYEKTFTIIKTETEEEAKRLIEKYSSPEIKGKVKLDQKTIHKPSPHNIKLIPKKAIPWIRKAFEAKNHDKLHNYRKKYEVATNCPTCQDLNAWNMRVWQQFFNEIDNQ